MHLPARRLLAALVLAVSACVAGLGSSAPAKAQVPYSQLVFSESRYAAIVVDANTGEVLYSKYADAQRHPASITKLMTLYLTFEQLQSGKMSLGAPVTMTAHCAAMMPTKLGLKPGESIDVNLAIQAAAIKSTNDVACALGEKIGGDESRFAALMTLRARELGMTNSLFVNASGVPDNRQIASARDIAILSRALMRDFPQYYHYFSQRSFVYRGQVINGHNHLLDSMPGVDGLKTGFTNASGFNVATSMVRNGRRLIAVVMGGSSAATRDNHMEDLLQAGFTVMARRDQGETVQFAQNLFEPDPTGPVTRPMIAQGDEDQPGLRIVVDQNLPKTVSPYSSTVYPPRPYSSAFSQPAPRRQLQVITPPGPQALLTKPSPQAPAKPVRAPDKTIRNAEASGCDDERAPARGGKSRRKTGSDKGCDAATRLAERDSGPRRRGDKREEDGGWIVQVGAFKDRASARSQLAKAFRAASSLTAGQGDVDTASRGVYRARFTGLSASEARLACASLRAKGHGCMAYEG